MQCLWKSCQHWSWRNAPELCSGCAYCVRLRIWAADITSKKIKLACDMARSFGLSYYVMFTNELRNISPSRSRSQIQAPVAIVGTSRSKASPSGKQNDTEMDDIFDEYVNQRVAKKD